MKRRVVELVLVASLTTAAFVAVDGCGDDSPGRSTTCSTGEPHDPNSFSQLPGSPTPNAPPCIPRCGEKPIASFVGMNLTRAALPSGACEHDREVCSMTAVHAVTCPSGEVATCSLSGFECHCESGNWKCYVVTIGASACSCPLPMEAGSDANAADLDAGSSDSSAIQDAIAPDLDAGLED